MARLIEATALASQPLITGIAHSRIALWSPDPVPVHKDVAADQS
jgi:hypothetical protein